VTAGNRLEYIHRVANYRLNAQIKRGADAFQRGLVRAACLLFSQSLRLLELQLSMWTPFQATLCSCSWCMLWPGAMERLRVQNF
jgi:hypothetical protein